ncbi:mitochondrial import inner membrane translocase subunit Tim29 [Cylas formicarius]|uniref:mitochondrial import inner membrane translocase subunit Tim29 n=1 Tax=Cylas formicarius TaxID=197179 RepID=UPI002958A9F1|nr:mitochondrial import inner membrane translocase subunit Tim29 [Cylas formicarius]
MNKIKYWNARNNTLDYLKVTNQTFQRKVKGTIVEKWIKYWKTLARDYKEVAISVGQDIKTKPLKSAAYFSAAGLLGYCATHNPNLQSFRAKYIECANNLNLVPQTLVNKKAAEHLKYMEQCFNAGLIRYINCGIFSVIWVDKYSEGCDLYENNCPYLQVPYVGVLSRILDIGFLNIWWITSRKMLDYDINY